MKKLLLIPALISLFACSKSRNLSDLKMHVDKPADVEAKFGKPDSIAVHNIFGMSAEIWKYRSDSLTLFFDNGILAKAVKNWDGTFGPTAAERNQMQSDAQRTADSIMSALDAVPEEQQKREAEEIMKKIQNEQQ